MYRSRRAGSAVLDLEAAAGDLGVLGSNAITVDLGGTGNHMSVLLWVKGTKKHWKYLSIQLVLCQETLGNLILNPFVIINILRNNPPYFFCVFRFHEFCP